MKERIILHIDMNAFFASVEQQANPALRGKPIAVIGAGGRTVITTASYEARRYGVKTGLTCSVGIAPNKLLAKLASEMKKPDGLTVIRPDDVSRVMDSLPIKDLCGIGSRTERRLNLLGIKTCGDLGRFPVDILRRKFGVIGQRLHEMGLGMDDSPVVLAGEQDRVKSVGHSMTLQQDISRRQDILKYLLQLSEMVGRRARRYGVSGKTISLYVRYADFYSSFGKQQTLASPISQSDDIYKAAIDILNTVERSRCGCSGSGCPICSIRPRNCLFFHRNAERRLWSGPWTPSTTATVTSPSPLPAF